MPVWDQEFPNRRQNHSREEDRPGMSYPTIAKSGSETFLADSIMNTGLTKLQREVASTFCGAQAPVLRAEPLKPLDVPLWEAVFSSGCHDPIYVVICRSSRNHLRTDIAKSRLPLSVERFSEYRLG